MKLEGKKGSGFKMQTGLVWDVRIYKEKELGAREGELREETGGIEQGERESTEGLEERCEGKTD